MSILNENLVEVRYGDIEDFSESNSFLADSLLRNFSKILSWSNLYCYDNGFPTRGNGKFMLPENAVGVIKNGSMNTDYIEYLFENSYYELIGHILEKNLAINPNSSMIYTWVSYFYSIYKLLADNDIKTASLPSEVIELLEREAKNCAKKQNKVIPQTEEINFEEWRKIIRDLYHYLIGKLFLFRDTIEANWINQFSSIVGNDEEFIKRILPLIEKIERFTDDYYGVEISEAAKIRKEFQRTIEQLSEQEKQCIDYLSALTIQYGSTCAGLPLNKKRTIVCKCPLFSEKYQLHIPDVLLMSKECRDGKVIAYYTYQAMLEGKVMFKSWCTPIEFAHLTPNTVDRTRT